MKTLSITFTVLAFAACGGGAAGESPGTTATTGEAATSTEPSAQSTPPDTTTPETTPAPQSQSPDPERSGAVITVDGETFTYAVVDDGGSCNPDFFGAFRAILTRIDENGDPVPLDGAGEGLTEGVTISVSETLEGVIGGPRWSAGNDGDETTSIDWVEIDGNHASGTATFAVGTDETAAGSFEVVCR